MRLIHEITSGYYQQESNRVEPCHMAWLKECMPGRASLSTANLTP